MDLSHNSSGLLRPYSSAYQQFLNSTLSELCRPRVKVRRRQPSVPENEGNGRAAVMKGFQKQRQSYAGGGVERKAKRRNCIREQTIAIRRFLTPLIRTAPTSRLTLNLIRKFIAYVSQFQTVNLSSSCKAFAKLIKEDNFEETMKKELKSILLYNDDTLLLSDLWDIERMQELLISGKHSKRFSFRSFIDICYIDSPRCAFYYWESDTIIEGNFLMYNESVEIMRSRPALPDTLCFDISGEYVACANEACLGICYPNQSIEYILHKRRTVHELRFIGTEKLIAFASSGRVDLFAFSLRLIKSVEFVGEVCQLFVPSTKANVFAVTTDASSIETYVVNGSTVLLNSRIANERNVHVKELLYHEHEAKGYKVLFSIVLFESHKLFINQKAYGTCVQIKLKDGFLAKVSQTEITILGVGSRNDRFHALKTYTVAPEVMNWVTVEVWKTKVMLVTNTGLYWCRKGLGAKLSTITDFKLPTLKAVEVKVFEEFVLVKGEDEDKKSFVSVFHFSVSDSLDLRASLTKK